MKSKIKVQAEKETKFTVPVARSAQPQRPPYRFSAVANGSMSDWFLVGGMPMSRRELLAQNWER